MKFIFIFSSFICLFLNSFSQNLRLSQNKSIDSNEKLHLEVYQNSMKSGDYRTAIFALNYLVVESENKNYQDSLAYLYFISGNYYQAIYWCKEILKFKLNDIKTLEIYAASLKRTNQYALAIQEYERLILINKNSIYVFNLCELQYEMKRLYECLITTNEIDKLSFTSEMNFPYSDIENDKEIHTTPLKAAILNYQGLAYYELGLFEKSLESFEKSLNVDSNFQLARINFEMTKIKLKINVSSPVNNDNSEKKLKSELKKE